MTCADITTVKKAVKLAIEKKYPFYAYSLPGTTAVHMALSIESTPHDKPDGHTPGFIMAPFITGDYKPLFIKEELPIYSEKEIRILEKLQSRCIQNMPVPNIVTTYEEYRAGAEKLLETIKQGEIKKAVYSRTSEYKSRAIDAAPQWFDTITRTYPSAFSFLVSVPGITTWMGATPELLLQYADETVRTMALAATKARSESREWSKKEDEEQQIVTRYIKEQFRKAGIEPDIYPREEYPAGPVTHLCNKIAAKGETFQKARELLKLMHPTPAVCGEPAEKAAAIITRLEKHDRRYYSGYLGPVKSDGSFSLFVNLRSMELFSERAQLYAGGGYTADSDIRSEWQETGHKITTLLSCIDKKDEYYNR